MVKSLLLVFWILTSCTLNLGQEPAGNRTTELRSHNCEVDESNFNVLRVDALEALRENEFLIAIARLGSRDKARGLNRRRLSAAKGWLNKAKFPMGRLILAEGEKVSGSGRIEFYIGGRLTHVILPRPNMGLCTECCNPASEDFTSYRRKKRQR